MEIDHDTTPVTPKKKLDKIESPTDDTNKLDKKCDPEDPKPRIVLTFRSEKPGAKSSNMKIVPTEEKLEEISPRRSNRTRAWASRWCSDDDNEVLVPPKKSHTSNIVSENESLPDATYVPPKRSARRRSKEFDNVMANAIARKKKSYNETPVPPRASLSRNVKPTFKIYENEELHHLLSQNSQHIGIQPERTAQDKSPEEGVRTRRSYRQTTSNQDSSQEAIKVDEADGDSQNQVMKLKHLCELGLKAIDQDEQTDTESKAARREKIIESIEIDDTEGTEDDEEIDDDSEVINKLLEADADSYTTSDEDFLCSDKEITKSDGPSHATRSSYYRKKDKVKESKDESESGRRRRSPRKRRSVKFSRRSRYKDNRKWREGTPSVQEDSPSSIAESNSEHEDASNPAEGEEGSEAACPSDMKQVVANCCCETVSNVYAAPEDLNEPVFCQAIELVDNIRVGCSHGARKEADGSYGAFVKAGLRAPYILTCKLHAMQLAKHMCCPACGLFCSQGIFYQCSEGHLFHLECGLPYNESKSKPGCPHCGVYLFRWQPVNKECFKVKVDMKCSNNRIFLPDQREQITPAYLSFSTLDQSKFDHGPIIPEDLLPSPPIDLKRLCQKNEGTEVSADTVYDAILTGESVDDLITKITACRDINAAVSRCEGGTCAHLAVSRGALTALYVLQFARANLDAVDSLARTPLMLAALALLNKGDKSPKKSQGHTNKEPTEEMDVETHNDEGIAKEKEDEDVKKEDEDIKKDGEDIGKKEAESPKDEDLMKVIRFLVAAGCDVNISGPDGMTALHLAAQYGGADVCAAILRAANAQPSPRDHGGWTPLVWAAENCHPHVVRLLLSEGADANATDTEGNAVIHWCALAGAARPLQLLLDVAPSAVSLTNAHTDTPLHVAARQGHYACVVILLARGARTDVENSAGELPVEVCSGQCQSAISLNMQMRIAVGSHAPRLRVLTNDISRGRERYPVPCVNEVDDTPLPEDFVYVTSHVTPQPVAIDTSTATLQGCSCRTGDCSSGTCECCVLGVRRWAWRGRLQSGFPYHDPPMLFECNPTCGCDAKKCGNNMITRLCKDGSLFVPASVFRCGAPRGWGLRAGGPLRVGTPVATYCGELLPALQADTRARDHYMFALDIKPDLREQCTDKTQLCVDAAAYGGAARFINHSCRPNLAPVRVFTATRDLRLPNVVLFATSDIQAGEEFTFDYGDKFWSVKSKWMRCECASPDCRYPCRNSEEDEE